MTAGLRTPLLDFFRRGDVARDVRLMAAQGAIAPRPLEQLGLLVLLTSDPDPDIRETAEATLSRIPPAVLSGFLARSEVPDEWRTFFADRGIAAAAVAGEEPELLPDGEPGDEGPEPVTEDDKASMVRRLAAMSVPERVKAAMKGTREVRAVLVRDPNKLVAMSVLSSPKLTEAEVEAIARMGSVSEDVLRTIGQSRAWTKNYGILSGLVRNPKTPIAISLTLLQRVTDRDLKAVSIDRNVPDPLRIAARKRVVLGEKR
ncbi:MAG: hypothetical protein AB7H88_08090 [Vicinamibacterales bacterium]